MTDKVKQLLRDGNHYAANKLWSAAAESYIQASKALMEGAPSGLLPIDSTLCQQLAQQQPVTVKLAAPQPPEHALDQLHAILKTIRETETTKTTETKESADSAVTTVTTVTMKTGSPSLIDATHATLFGAPGDHTIIVYHRLDETKKEYDTLDPQTHPGIPDAGTLSSAYILREQSSAIEVLSSVPGRQPLLAYIMSHLGDARFNQFMAQNQHGPNLLLTESSKPKFKRAEHDFYHSLLLWPKGAWAWAHWAETYRNVANSWTGGLDAITMCGSRAPHYIRAMVCFQIAIDLEPKAWWALAHYGAAVVNARAFLSVTTGKPGDDTTATDEAVNAWFAAQDFDQDACATASSKSLALLAKAGHLLESSLTLKGHYNPWAQIYQGDVHLIRSLLLNGEAGRFLGIVAMLETNAGMFYDPRLAEDLLDPGAPYVNGFFQVALVFYWARYLNRDNLKRAWDFAILGTRRMQNFKATPELYHLYAGQILFHIAIRFFTERDDHNGIDVPLIEDACKTDYLQYLKHETTSTFPVQFASEGRHILRSEADLEGFLKELVKVGLSAANSFRSQELATADIEVLKQVKFIFEDIQMLVSDQGGQSPTDLDTLLGNIESLLPAN